MTRIKKPDIAIKEVLSFVESMLIEEQGDKGDK